jgi:hypothetical protein
MPSWQIKPVFRLATVAGCLFLVAGRLSGQQHPTPCSSETGAILIQKVIDQTTRIPLRAAHVSASWHDGIAREVRARTDSTGIALLCVPAHQVITMRAFYGDVAAAPQTTVVGARTSTTHTAYIDAPGSLFRGRVIDHETGNGVAQVSIRIANTSLATLTHPDGRFVFERVPLGDYQVQVEHVAYRTANTLLTVHYDDLDALVRLTPAAITLPPVVVTAFSQRLEFVGFYERQRRGVGTFINRTQIDAMNVQAASDLLRAVPSLRLVPLTRRSSQRNATVGRRGNCRFAFIVDGIRMLSDFEIDYIAAPAVEGIEVYNGLAEVPAAFRAHATTSSGVTVCGVIAIWSRNSR